MDGWDKFYECVLEEALRLSREKLERFRESLGNWLHGQLNWPSDDWQRQLELLVEHTRYYGLVIEPECVQSLHELIEARVKQTGPFAIVAAGGAESIQVAVGLAVDDGTRTDATLPLGPASAESRTRKTTKDGLEVAGPGPKTSKSYQEKVRVVLELLDAKVAALWRSIEGIVESRDARWLRWNYYSERRGKRTFIVVDQSYTAADTAVAILKEVYSSVHNVIRSEWLRRQIHRPDGSDRLREIQNERFKRAVAQVALIAELYVSGISSLTPAGEVVVTIDEVSRNGFHWEHLLLTLPFMAVFRRGVTSVKIKLPSGRELDLSGETLKRFLKLDPRKQQPLLAKARKAKTPEPASL